MAHGNRLGIGVITYNRKELVTELVDTLLRLTSSPFALVVADDGSKDGTAEAIRAQGHTVVTGSNRGCAWNKNRALTWLMNQTDSDPILLLEDDCHPNVAGWEADWIEAAAGWHHVNAVCYGIGPEVTGDNTPSSPWRCFAFAGVCTISTREALTNVGFLDTRFHGYGYEHVEWTSRFTRRYQAMWGPPQGGVPCLWRGLEMRRERSHYDAVQMKKNQALWPFLCHDPVYRDAWRSEEERLTLLAEITEAKQY